ncbi:MAG TPA: hypothetical protein VNZ01_06450 [Solirubrobacteraceae bacterium]|jgi:hypothetical protein|nr:hypothetical protein [Solirubrobacteraceae bacterium]
MLRRVMRLLALTATLSALSASSALAAKGGAGTETFTEHAHEVLLFSFSTENQCTGAEGTLSAIAANEVFHITTHADGDLWVTGTAEGTATFVPFGPGVSYSGHFVNWFGEALNQKNQVGHSTGTFVLTGTDGSRVVIHMTSHLSTNAHGAVTVEFERSSVHCG